MPIAGGQRGGGEPEGGHGLMAFCLVRCTAQVNEWFGGFGQAPEIHSIETTFLQEDIFLSLGVTSALPTFSLPVEQRLPLGTSLLVKLSSAMPRRV